jgi:hypothetical protein
MSRRSMTYSSTGWQRAFLDAKLVSGLQTAARLQTRQQRRRAFFSSRRDLAWQPDGARARMRQLRDRSTAGSSVYKGTARNGDYVESREKRDRQRDFSLPVSDSCTG